MKNNIICYFVLLMLVGCFVAHTLHAKPKVPSTSQKYTVRQLVDLINTSNRSKTSKFLVLIDAPSVKTGRYTAAANLAQGSASTERVKAADETSLQGIIQSNLDTSVMLLQDSALIDKLFSDGRLDGTNKEKYKQILLYFELTAGDATYRFYINDPFPGKIVRVKGKRRSPADNIIKKWDFTP